jgi:phosphoesterase RecJ-like protein
MGEESSIRDAARLVADAPAIGLACHLGPDGDALGSMLAMAVAADRAGKKVFPSFGEPFTVPDSYRYLPTDLLVPPDTVPEGLPLFMSFDAGSADRLGELWPVAASAADLVVVDHHRSNEGFGTLDLVDPDASATAEIVAALLDALGWEIDSVIATCLHTGIVTDTGRFQYSNTSPSTLRLAARLVEAGARPEQVGRHVYEESPFGFLGLAGAVLSSAALDSDRRFVWAVLTADDLARSGIGLDDTDPLIDLVRVARESDVALLVKELEPGRVKASLRSRGRVDVAAIASALGGGGHHNAAGFTYHGSVDDAVDAVRSRLEVVADDDG